MFVAFRALESAAASVIGILIPVILADLLNGWYYFAFLMHETSRSTARRCPNVPVSLGYCIEVSLKRMFEHGTFFFSMLTGIISSWIVTSSSPWQSAMLAASVLSILPFVVLFFLRSHIRNVQRTDYKQGVGRVLTSAFGMLSV